MSDEEFIKKIESLETMSREELLREAKLGIIAQKDSANAKKELNDLITGKTSLDELKKIASKGTLGQKMQSGFDSNWKSSLENGKVKFRDENGEEVASQG